MCCFFTSLVLLVPPFSLSSLVDDQTDSLRNRFRFLDLAYRWYHIFTLDYVDLCHFVETYCWCSWIRLDFPCYRFNR